MLNRLPRLFPIACLVLMIACNEEGGKTTPGVAGINRDSLVAAVKVLSSDSFQGRKPFTQGESITVSYLQNKFAAIGLEPGNGNSYFQDVPMVNIMATAAPTMKVQSAEGTF